MSAFAAFLIPRQQITENGQSPAFARPAAEYLQLTLGIETSQEQQSFELLVEGSPDGENWAERPLAAFPQKFYTGISSILVHLPSYPEAQLLRVRWRVNRWGRGELKARFDVYLFAEELASVELDSK